MRVSHKVLASIYIILVPANSLQLLTSGGMTPSGRGSFAAMHFANRSAVCIKQVLVSLTVLPCGRYERAKRACYSERVDA